LQVKWFHALLLYGLVLYIAYIFRPALVLWILLMPATEAPTDIVGN
jgi:hypothetical protein